MPVNLQGQIVDQQGNPTGGQVNLNTGQMTAQNTYSPANTSISGSDLITTPTPNFQTPKITSPESIAGLTVPSIPPLEQKAEDYTTQIQDLQNQLLGKGTFERQQQQQFGIPEKNQAILDYQTRLDELKKKEAVIQTQYGGSLAANQGVLEPFVTGEKDARLRQNAVEALTVSANIDAMKGLITSAQSKVDLAIQQKYGPDEERLKIAQANLDTLVKSGSLTREQERQAQNQQLVLRQQENNLAIERDKAHEAQQLAIQIAASNPNINSQTLQSMQQAKSAFDVLNIAQSAGLSVNPNLSKQTTDTVFNLAQTYPDSGILPNDTLQQAQAKVTSSPLFKAHLAQVEAGRFSLHFDPNTGGTVILDTKTGLAKGLTAFGQPGTNVTLAGTNLGPANPEGRYDQALSGLPDREQAIVRQLVDYKIPLPAGFALKSPFWQRLLGAAAQYDPAFDATQYNVRLALRTSFTSGQDSQNALALNTVVGHLDTLKKTIDNMSYLRFLPYSSRYQTTVNNFELAKDAVASELTRVFRGSGGAEAEVLDWKDNFNARSSTGVLQNSIPKAIDLIASRIQALTSKYETGMGKPKNFAILNDKSRQILQKFGEDVNTIDPIKNQLQNISNIQTAGIIPSANAAELPNLSKTSQDILNKYGIK